jgi:hypothetical protein
MPSAAIPPTTASDVPIAAAAGQAESGADGGAVHQVERKLRDGLQL